MFIAIEGNEGAGKSTVISSIIAELRGKGINCIATREPGGTLFGEQLRKLILDNADKIDPMTELLGMFMARKHHLNSVIEPIVKNNVIVFTDRFSLSTYAYQGYGRGIDLNLIDQLYKLVFNDFKPDLTLLLDVSFKKSQKRTEDRIKRDYFELAGQEFFDKVRNGYLELASKDDSIVVFDADKSLKTVTKQALKVVLNHIS